MAQRLIDADHLLHEIAELQKSPWYNTGKEIDPNFPHMHVGYLERKEAIEIVRDLCIKQEPTVDADLVVRCKQCKQWDDSSEGRYVGGWCFCDRLQMSTSPDWFCADGEVKHEQTN